MLTLRKTAILLTVVLTLMIVPTGVTGARSSKVMETQSQQVFIRDKPINCEDFQALLDFTIIDWMKLKGTHLILIVRLGNGEHNRKLNRQRLEFIEDYLKSHEVEFVLAEGTRVKGFGRVEVYVGGRLAMSIPIQKGSRRLCWGTNG